MRREKREAELDVKKRERRGIKQNMVAVNRCVCLRKFTSHIHVNTCGWCVVGGGWEGC